MMGCREHVGKLQARDRVHSLPRPSRPGVPSLRAVRAVPHAVVQGGPNYRLQTSPGVHNGVAALGAAPSVPALATAIPVAPPPAQQLGSVPILSSATGRNPVWCSASPTFTRAAPRSSVAAQAAQAAAQPGSDNRGHGDAAIAAVRWQLAVLDEEARQLTGKLDTAREAWLTADSADKPAYKVVLDQRLEEKKALNARLEKLEAQLAPASRSAVPVDRDYAAAAPRLLEAVDMDFARQVFRSFPAGTVPSNLEPERLRELLQTPPDVLLYDPQHLLEWRLQLRELLKGCVISTTNSKGAISVADVEAGNVYQQLARMCKEAEPPNTATRTHWSFFWIGLVATMVSVAAKHASVPLSYDIGMSDATISTAEALRDIMVKLDGIVLLRANVYAAAGNEIDAREAVQRYHQGASPALYGQLRWVMYLIAVGTRVQLYAAPSIDRGPTNLHSITGSLDVSNPAERAQLLLALINLVRMASSIHQERWLPRGVRMMERQMLESPYSPPNSLLPPSVAVTVHARHVLKEYSAPGWALSDNLPVYQAIMDGLLPNTVTVDYVQVGLKKYSASEQCTSSTYEDDSLYFVRVSMRPVADPRPPRTTDQLWQLVHDVLELLVELHKLGFCHRDIRLANVYRLDERWILTDWELAGADGVHIKYNIKRLPEEVQSKRAPYSQRTDLWQLAELIKDAQFWTGSCPGAQAFAKVLVEADMTAAAALKKIKSQQW